MAFLVSAVSVAVVLSVILLLLSSSRVVDVSLEFWNGSSLVTSFTSSPKPLIFEIKIAQPGHSILRERVFRLHTGQHNLIT